MQSNLITKTAFRGSYVNLAEPRGIAGDPNSAERYSMLIPLPKDDEFWTEAKAFIDAKAKDKWGNIPPKLKTPIKDGDDMGESIFAGCLYIQASNDRQPGLVDAALKPITDPNQLYSGAWYRASLTAYAWEHPTGGKGVSFSLANVQFVRDDEPLDGRTSPQDDFKDFMDESAATPDDAGDDLLA